MITQEELKNILKYDPENGLFIWLKLKVKNQIMIGDIAGHDDPIGYRRITINNKSYPLHHLAWLYMFGEFPYSIDHIDGNKKNNSIYNLRLATQAENMQNYVKPTERNQCGVLGVYYDKWTRGLKKWRACIGVNGKTINLKRWMTIEEAQKAYIEARIKYFPFNTLEN